jgi:hypothetical protein
MGMGSSSRKEEDAAQMVLICLELIEVKESQLKELGLREEGPAQLNLLPWKFRSTTE